MHEAKYWEKIKIGVETGVKCSLCPHNCIITEGKIGVCGVRQNISGRLYSLVYGKPVSINIDPIEKKPLYHFLPGSRTLSIGTVGCNLFCMHCQNWEITRARPKLTTDDNASIKEIDTTEIKPDEIIKLAIESNCESISYTYNEPTIFHEYAVNCAKLARKKGIKNIIVTNGYINKEAGEEFIKYMDAANVDLKAFNNTFYKEICKGKMDPVLDTLKLYNKKIWIEITNLLIDGKNDNMKEIEEMSKWIAKKLSPDVPLHFSKAFPMHKMINISPTPEKTLTEARKTAKKILNYVYIGNIDIEKSQNTFCPDCKKELIIRRRYDTVGYLKDSKCECGKKIPGVF